MVDQRNRDRKEKELCSATDLNEMYKEMTNYGSAAFLEQTSMHQKILLLGLSQCIRRSGVPEVALIDVSDSEELDECVTYFLLWFLRS